jgi:hypothetical protein
MHSHQDTLRNLSVLEHGGQHCFFVYIKIIALPLAVYLYFILGYIDVLDFRVGAHSVVLIGLIFLVALLFARHNAEFAACYFKRHNETFRVELKNYIVKNLMSIGEHTKSNASFEDFIEEYSRRVRNDNYASVGAGIFPTMGILGTFISIAMTMPDFSSQTAEALESEISMLLTGVGTAFYVSIYGILLSLWWIFFEKRGLSRFDREVELIKQETASLFWTKEEIEQSYLRENLQHFQKIGDMFERLSSNDFFERLGKSIEEKFGLFDEMLRLEAQSVRMGAAHLKEGMEALASSQEKQRDLGTLHGHILDALHQFNDNISRLHVTLFKENEKSLEAHKGVEKTLATSVAKITEHLVAVSAHMESTQKAILEKFVTTLQEIQEKAQGDLSGGAKEVESLRESLKMIDAETEQIIQKLDALK